MPAPVPATPLGASRSRWPVVAGLVGVAVAIGLVVAIFAHSSPSPASPPLATAAPTTPPQVAPPPSVAAPTVEPATVTVAMEVDPDDAEVFQDGNSLGTSPVAIEVPEGKTISVEARRAGFVTRQIPVDGTQRKLKVKLDKVPGAVAPPHARPVPHPPVAHATTPDAPKPKPKSSIGGSEIVNPWGH
jgi:hypothetical protein